MSETRFESVESQQATALREIAEQLKRLNDTLDTLRGRGSGKEEFIRVVDMSRPPW